MPKHIFDREVNDFLKDEDGEKLSFKDNWEVYDYLNKDCHFTDDWIKGNFYICKSCKILIPDPSPEFKEILEEINAKDQSELEYWKKRAELAEKVYIERLKSPDSEAHDKAFDEWHKVAGEIRQPT